MTSDNNSLHLLEDTSITVNINPGVYSTLWAMDLSHCRIDFNYTDNSSTDSTSEIVFNFNTVEETTSFVDTLTTKWDLNGTGIGIIFDDTNIPGIGQFFLRNTTFNDNHTIVVYNMTVTGVNVSLTVNHILSTETISPGREISLFLSDYNLSKNIQNSLPQSLRGKVDLRPVISKELTVGYQLYDLCGNIDTTNVSDTGGTLLDYIIYSNDSVNSKLKDKKQYIHQSTLHVSPFTVDVDSRENALISSDLSGSINQLPVSRFLFANPIRDSEYLVPNTIIRMPDFRMPNHDTDLYHVIDTFRDSSGYEIRCSNTLPIPLSYVTTTDLTLDQTTLHFTFTDTDPSSNFVATHSLLDGDIIQISDMSGHLFHYTLSVDNTTHTLINPQYIGGGGIVDTSSYANMSVNFSSSSPILLELVYPKVYTSTINQDISANIFRPSNEHSYDFYYDTNTDILVLQSTRSNLMPSVKDGLDYVLTRTPGNLFNVRGRLIQKESDGNYMFFDVSANPEIIERVRTIHVESDSTKTSGVLIPTDSELVSVLLYLNSQDFIKSNNLFVSIEDGTILFEKYLSFHIFTEPSGQITIDRTNSIISGLSTIEDKIDRGLLGGNLDILGSWTFSMDPLYFTFSVTSVGTNFINYDKDTGSPFINQSWNNSESITLDISLNIIDDLLNDNSSIQLSSRDTGYTITQDTTNTNPIVLENFIQIGDNISPGDKVTGINKVYTTNLITWDISTNTSTLNSSSFTLNYTEVVDNTTIILDDTSGDRIEVLPTYDFTDISNSESSPLLIRFQSEDFYPSLENRLIQISNISSSTFTLPSIYPSSLTNPINPTGFCVIKDSSGNTEVILKSSIVSFETTSNITTIIISQEIDILSDTVLNDKITFQGLRDTSVLEGINESFLLTGPVDVSNNNTTIIGITSHRENTTDSIIKRNGPVVISNVSDIQTTLYNFSIDTSGNLYFMINDLPDSRENLSSWINVEATPETITSYDISSSRIYRDLPDNLENYYFLDISTNVATYPYYSIDLSGDIIVSQTKIKYEFEFSYSNLGSGVYQNASDNGPRNVFNVIDGSGNGETIILDINYQEGILFINGLNTPALTFIRNQTYRIIYPYDIAV